MPREEPNFSSRIVSSTQHVHQMAAVNLSMPVSSWCYQNSAAQQSYRQLMMYRHPGINKTRCRVLGQFYWPGVFKDVADHCRQCEVCQRSPGRQDRVRTKMIPMPLIEKPFQRIAMGIMGPLMKKPIWQQIYPDHLTVPHSTQRPYLYPVLKPRESPRNW